MSLFAELRRRNLFRVATFYAAASWLLVQIATQILPYFGVPDAALRWLVVVLAVGFIPALVFAWYFEWTPTGIQRESAVPRRESITRETGRKLDFWIIGVLSLIVVGLLVDALVPRGDVSKAPDKSVAVLPFANAGGDAGNQYFSDGLSEDLIAALSQIGGLKVISRNSSFRFRGNTQDSGTIGRKLGVAHLVQGSVRRSGDRVGVYVELINVADGSSMWSQRYERAYDDLFALEDELARAVAMALKAEMSMGGGGFPAQNDRPPSGNLAAYNAYLQGKFYRERRSEADYRKAVDSFAEAIRLDPQYASAHAGLAFAWTDLASYYLSGDEALQAYASARSAVGTALRLAPDLAYAHLAKGWLLTVADRDWNGADAEFRRALQLTPNDSAVKTNLGSMQATLGHLSRAIDLTREAIETDPLFSEGHTALAAYLSSLGRLDAARQAIDKAIELQPGAGYERVQLAIIAIQRGDGDAARAALRQVHDEGGWLEIARAFVAQVGSDRVAADAALQVLVDTQADISAFQIAEVHALRGDPDKVFEWLDRAQANRDPGLSRLWYDPFILRYKHDPRFADFCRKVGLPDTGEGISVPSAADDAALARQRAAATAATTAS